MDEVSNDIELKVAPRKISQAEPEGYIEVSSLLRPPNCEDVESIPKVANNGRNPAVRSACFSGKFVPEGTFAVYDNSSNSTIDVVGYGEWTTFLTWRKFWVDDGYIDLMDQKNNPYNYESLTIVQVFPSDYGLATYHGKPVILAP